MKINYIYLTRRVPGILFINFFFTTFFNVSTNSNVKMEYFQILDKINENRDYGEY